MIIEGDTIHTSFIEIADTLHCGPLTDDDYRAIAEDLEQAGIAYIVGKQAQLVIFRALHLLDKVGARSAQGRRPLAGDRRLLEGVS